MSPVPSAFGKPSTTTTNPYQPSPTLTLPPNVKDKFEKTAPSSLLQGYECNALLLSLVRAFPGE
jgi:hypothetical protein|eukprot:CAMPEP_0174301064 /NCGR_PEP_ID=MMETSP0809-20121228/58830_1 /TAXON_ID=73025 ORGANISM="Eutreptiella gymnastica-like, Strain CCMP1594" /NCGR_SAMPLE_ID=MMETSP0809 /ASSEMBLY_ACC=CAM_ASM_000658 /LENGTH=63 /DNA_ID=CAMNT_0015406747 /DNA_START=812 /DNA_END=1003 /DNA_ORIENTATION=+